MFLLIKAEFFDFYSYFKPLFPHKSLVALFISGYGKIFIK